MHSPLTIIFGFHGTVCPFYIKKVYKDVLLLKLCPHIFKAIGAFLMYPHMGESYACFCCLNLTTGAAMA